MGKDGRKEGSFTLPQSAFEMEGQVVLTMFLQTARGRTDGCCQPFSHRLPITQTLLQRRLKRQEGELLPLQDSPGEHGMAGSTAPISSAVHFLIYWLKGHSSILDIGPHFTT